MLKLYRRERGKVISYHEAWEADGTITEHWGKIGARGTTREHATDPAIDSDEGIARVLADARQLGYEEIEPDDHAVLLIEFAIDGTGTKADLDRRHALQSRMDETLGWTGLGHCDGGSSGSGTMEVCCLVVDFEVAKRIIEKDLQGTVFKDFTRIYQEDGD